MLRLVLVGVGACVVSMQLILIIFAVAFDFKGPQKIAIVRQTKLASSLVNF